MNAPVSITAALDDETAALLSELTIARGISREEYAVEAIRDALERERDFLAYVQEGIDSADRGELISQEAMKAWFEERVAARANR